LPTEKFAFRIDFINEVTEVGKDGKISGYLIPNPERYEWRELEGKKYLYDKFDNLAIPQEEFIKAASQLTNLPIYYTPPDIQDTRAYLESKRSKINEFLDSKETKCEHSDKSEEFLRALERDKLKFVILCIDIVGSTKLSASLPLEDFKRLIELFSREIGNVVTLHRGYVLKYTGDGLIAYFPEPNFIGMNDNAVDSAVTMKMLVEQVLNAVLVERGKTPLGIRIGIDSGEAAVAIVGEPSTKQHKDIIGLTINFAAKIQAIASPGGIVIGDATARNLHVDHRKYFVKANAPGWGYDYPLWEFHLQ